MLAGTTAPPRLADIPDQYLQCEQAGTAGALLDCLQDVSGEIKDIRFKGDGTRATILSYAEAELRPGALDRLSVNLKDRTVDLYKTPRSVPALTRVLDWMYPIHVGNILGALRIFLMPLFALAAFSVMAWAKKGHYDYIL